MLRPTMADWHNSIAHFECEPCFHFVRQHFGNHTIKIIEDFHRELRLDAAFVDQVINRVNKRLADAGIAVSVCDRKMYRMQGLTIDDNRGAFQGRADPFVQFPVYGLPASPVELIVMCRHDHGQICDYYEAKQRMMSTTENIPGVVKT